VAALALLAGACAERPVAVDAVAPTGPPDPPRRWQAGTANTTFGRIDEARAGDLRPEPATPTALAVRWPIVGDHNGNAEVRVAYRRVDTDEWHAALPLFWRHPEAEPAHLRVPGGRLFAGSIVGLQPDTRYEVRLDLADPDGGSERRTLKLRTTREPEMPSGLRIRHVVPGDEAGGSGTVGDPFRGLGAALAAAEPGDLIELAPGLYRAAGVRPARSGRPGRPIVLRGAPDGASVLDGGGAAVLLDLSGQAHLWVEHLTLQGAGILIEAAGANHIVVRRNLFHVDERRFAAGIAARNARYDESQGFFVTDNVFQGPNAWPRASRRKEDPERIFGIALSGAGHVIAHNLIRGVGDGINNGRGGHLSASDIHHNEIEACTDDGIETDYAETNLRVFRNRITNCFSGISAQPALGGPVYVFRNLILNTWYSPFKLHNGTSGVLLFHNSSVKSGIPFLMRPGPDPISDVISRNNLFAGCEGPALRSTGRMVRDDFDADGYAWPSGRFAEWNGARYGTPAAARASGALYAGRGAIELSAGALFASGLTPPRDHRYRYASGDNDLRLARGSAAVDAGVRLPNFNDGFAGGGPDLGCCELGAALPWFGPRPE